MALSEYAFYLLMTLNYNDFFSNINDIKMIVMILPIL